MNKEAIVHHNKENGFFMKAFLMLGLFVLSTTAYADINLEKMDFSSLPDGKTQIALIFSEPVTEPKSFSMDAPARIVFDFAGVRNKLTTKTQAINIGVARSVSTIEAGDRTRMVLNLSQIKPYTINKQENRLLITISGDSNSVQAPSTVIAPPSVQASNSEPVDTSVLDDQTTSKQPETIQAPATFNGQQITDIDFRRGANGEGRVLISLSKPGITLNLQRQANQVIVDLSNVTLPNKLRRRLDVIDFATPATLIDTAQHGKDTQLKITAKGEFEYLSYQTDKNIVIEIKPISATVKEAARIAKRGYTGEKLSLNFQDIEVRAVLQILADFTGLNLVTSDSVTGNITLRLKNVPWDQALDIIMKTKGLAKRVNGNVILVAPAIEISATEKQEIEAQQQRIQLEPLYSERQEINFAKASDIAILLQGKSTGDNSSEQKGEAFLSKRGTVSVDERTNSLLLRDTADNLAQIKELINILDIPVRQVMVEARIVIASDDFTKELGMNFGVQNINGSGFNGGAKLDATGEFNVNLPIANPAGRLTLALAKLSSDTLINLELSAMQKEGMGEVISSPRVITSNRSKALIEQGTEIPYLEASSSGAATVSFKKAVLKLEVTPQITPDGHIILDLAIHKDSVGKIFSGIPSIDTRKIITQVLVQNGETIVLGGVYEQESVSGSTRVPFFGDLPIVGRLFRTEIKQRDKRELLIFITPKIIEQNLTLD